MNNAAQNAYDNQFDPRLEADDDHYEDNDGNRTELVEQYVKAFEKVWAHRRELGPG